MKKTLSVIFAVLFALSSFTIGAFALGTVDVTVPEPVVGNKVYTNANTLVDYTVSPSSDDSKIALVTYYKRKSGTDDEFELIKALIKNGKKSELVDDVFEAGYDYCVNVDTMDIYGTISNVTVNGHKTEKIADGTYRYIFGTEDEETSTSFIDKIIAPIKAIIELIKNLLSTLLSSFTAA